MSHNVEVLDLRYKLVFVVIFCIPVLQCGLVFRGGDSPVVLSTISILYLLKHTTLVMKHLRNIPSKTYTCFNICYTMVFF